MKIEKFDNKTWELLQKIKGAISFNNSLEIIWKSKQANQIDFFYERGEIESLAKLKKLGTIKKTVESVSLKKFEGLAGYAEAYTYDIHKDRGEILYLNVIQPRFDEVYQEYKKHYQDKNQIKQVKEKIENLKYLGKEKDCYLEIKKKKIKIGKTNTRKCKLLKCLLSDAPGVARTLDIVFGDIQIPKDRGDSTVWDEYLGRNKKKSIIINTTKEIKRIINNTKDKPKNHLIFHIKNNRIWVELE